MRRLWRTSGAGSAKRAAAAAAASSAGAVRASAWSCSNFLEFNEDEQRWQSNSICYKMRITNPVERMETLRFLLTKEVAFYVNTMIQLIADPRTTLPVLMCLDSVICDMSTTAAQMTHNDTTFEAPLTCMSPPLAKVLKEKYDGVVNKQSDYTWSVTARQGHL